MNARTIFIGCLLAHCAAGALQSASAAERTPPGMDHSREQIQFDLQKILDCEFDRALIPNSVICGAKKSENSVLLTFDEKGSLETVEIGALVGSRPRPRPQAEKASEEAVLEVIEYMLPMWVSTDWIRKSLKIVAKNDAFSIVQVPYLVVSDDPKYANYANRDIEIEQFTVLVRWHQYVDRPYRNATIVITRNPALDRWLPLESVLTDFVSPAIPQ